jgi:hypothetical protein
MSILTLASLLGLVLATVRYSSPSSETVTEVQTPVAQVKPFSILDYLSPSSLSTSLFDPTPSSIMPDVRLIKNALSLSTKSVGLAPAEIKSQVKTAFKDGEKGTGSNAVALRGGEAGLTAFLQGSSSTWQKARDMVMPSTPPVVVPKSINDSKSQLQTYGQMIIGDIKAAWTRTLSTYSHADFIHYARNQIMATIQLEIQQAILLAKYLVEVSKNVSEATRPYFQQGANQVLKTYHDVKSYTTSINITASADIATSRAKSGYENVTSKAAMTSQKGREAIQQARAGLEYLVSEARRKAGIVPDSDSIKSRPVKKGRFGTFKDRSRPIEGNSYRV